MTKYRRRRLYIDAQVQKPLIKRLVIYWIAMVLFITLPIAISQTLASPDQLLVHNYWQTLVSHWPILATLTVLLPFVIYDTLKFSNRFAGPMFRLRRELKRFATGEDIPTLRLRPNDFWQDMAGQINELIERVKVAESKVVEQQQTPPVPPIVTGAITSSYGASPTGV